MNLVIVESPTKAKTINKYLGKEYIVKSSYGHVRDLPVKPKPKKEGKRTLADVMGVDPTHNWKATYEILPGKNKVIKELKEVAKKVDTVYLAADPDREGEAIAWHLQETLKKANKNLIFHRVSYQEITQKAILQAFNEPGKLNLNRVDAYKARRFLDRVVGFQISPLLWKFVASGLSAGRVQSVALRMIVDREKEIKAFNPKEFWTIHEDLSVKENNIDFKVNLIKYQGQKIELRDKQAALEVVEYLSNTKHLVTSSQNKPTSSKPYPPFITSTLQQSASVRLGFGVKKTMYLAQKLYENGYITYMRTDSPILSLDAVKNIKEFINKNYGSRYLPEKDRTYSSNNLAQEAHEAIRPSDIYNTGKLASVDSDAIKLYDLIWRQTVASQMSDAKFDVSTANIQAGDYELQAKGRVIKFEGWQKALPVKVKEGDLKAIPDLKPEQELTIKEIEKKQHFTKPLPRYSEASLVKELEKKGIGRPSTYAQIISTIQDRGYVEVIKRRFYTKKIGEIVSVQLVNSFADLMNYDFTALLEKKLDSIANSTTDWLTVLNSFYKGFQEKIKDVEQKGMLNIDPTTVSINCDKCGRPLILHIGRNGAFLGCSGYKLPKKEQCKTTQNLIKVDTPLSKNLEDENEDEGNENELLEKKRCPKCKMAMDVWLLDQTTLLHVCGNYPICNGIQIENGDFKSLIPVYDGPTVHCDKCNSLMERKDGRFGPYFACTKAPECKNTRKILRSGEVAPPKADPILLEDLPCEKCKSPMFLRDGARGLFLACSKFPKCRGCSNVPSSVIVKYKDQLDEKFKHLTEVPIVCPDCGKEDIVLHWSVKNKKFYYSCHNKKCKWILHFD